MCETNLVVNDGHVKIAQLLEGICKIRMRLSHLGLQNDAAVIEGYALVKIAELVVDGTNQEQQAGLRNVLGIYLATEARL